MIRHDDRDSAMATQRPDEPLVAEHPVADREEHRPARPATHPKKQTTNNKQNDKSAPSVYVANLPYGASEREIHDLFGEYGKVHQATIITDKKSGLSKGFGFVDMPQRAARRAIEGLHGSTYAGRDLTVRFAQPRQYGG